MPTNAAVTLDVRNSASNGSDGFTNTTTSKGTTYCYKYTGGTDTHGGTYEHSRGTATIAVTLSADARYQITGVSFTEPAGQPNEFTGSVTSTTTASITDLNDKVGSGAFCIQVTDTTANCTLPCDPIIENDPN